MNTRNRVTTLLFISFLTLTCLLGSLNAAFADLPLQTYVERKGSDSNDGSASSPLSIQAATGLSLLTTPLR